MDFFGHLNLHILSNIIGHQLNSYNTRYMAHSGHFEPANKTKGIWVCSSRSPKRKLSLPVFIASLQTFFLSFPKIKANIKHLSYA